MLKALLSLALLSLPIGLQAAPTNRSSDYQAVRRIALRDPKVRAAYDAADRKLADRIVEIDPTLKGYTPGNSEAAPKARESSARSAKPAAPRKTASASITHVVAKNETLGGIATRYGVTVDTLKSANRIRDERKLAVGQKLVVPGGRVQRQPLASRTEPKPAQKQKSDGFWSQLGL